MSQYATNYMNSMLKILNKWETTNVHTSVFFFFFPNRGLCNFILLCIQMGIKCSTAWISMLFVGFDDETSENTLSVD